MSHDNLAAACRSQGPEYRQQLATTPAHEIAHAYQETLGLDDLDEETAEAFARRWMPEGAVDVEVLAPSADPDASFPS